MLIDTNRAAAAICPNCSEAVILPVSPFSFSGKRSVSIKCMSKGCNSSCAEISPRNRKFNLSVRCAFCGDIHQFTVDSDKLWKRDIITFPCPHAGIDIFFFGSAQKVHHALEACFSRIENMLKDTAYEIYNGSLFDENGDIYGEDDILYDILDELDELREEGLLSCICGSEAVSINPIDGAILISCPRCRRSKRLEINEQTLSMIINATAIVLGK